MTSHVPTTARSSRPACPNGARRGAAPRRLQRSKRPASWLAKSIRRNRRSTRHITQPPQQALDDPQIRAAGLLEEVTFPGLDGTLPLAPTPIELSETPGTYRH